MWSSNVVLDEIFVVIEKARLNAGFFALIYDWDCVGKGFREPFNKDKYHTRIRKSSISCYCAL